jgi:dTDP-4-dehydrorhamnose reductase
MPVNRPLRLVVTGRHGQVARALQEYADQNVEVLTLARPELDLASAVDPTPFFSRLRPDVVVNAAAYTVVDKAEAEYDVALAINGRGAGLVAQAASKQGVPVIQISTDYVFNGCATRPYREVDATAPVNAYGMAKLAGEDAVKAATLDHVILRTSWVYSPYGSNFLLTMLRLATQRDELRVVEDQYGAPTSAFDIAAAILTLAHNLVDRPEDASLRGIFHFANAGETTWADFAREIFKLSAERGGASVRVVPIPTSQYPTPARRPAYSVLDIAKIGQVHGVEPPHWKQALRAVLQAREVGLPAPST